MIKIENVSTYNWEGAIRGMRNPMNSWAKSDTVFDVYNTNGLNMIIGKNDLDLMKRLRAGNADDRKYLRQIFVCMDITAPLYMWKEADQYKVGTVTNSCSTMHKISAKEFTLDDFSYDTAKDDEVMRAVIEDTLSALNKAREFYLETKDKKYWRYMIELLPTSYNQKRTWTANYEVLINIYHARKNHKLTEWREFCKFIETLPYAKELIINE